MNFQCPHCKKPGIGLIAKLYIGPKKPAVCRVCGGQAAVSDRLAILSLLPLLLGILGALCFESTSVRLLLVVTGFSTYVTFFSLKVPLKKAL